jgi:hypothetical protein
MLSASIGGWGALIIKATFTKLIVSSNNERYFCASTTEIFQWVIDTGRSTLGCFRRYTNRSAKAFDGEPTISNHSAYRALRHLPVFSHLAHS